MAHVMGVAKFERLFRLAAGLDVDKNDLRRLNDFVRDKIRDLLLVAEAAARSNGRDVVQLRDLPITKGLQESLRAFDKLDTELELDPILEMITALPMLDLAYGTEVEEEMPRIVGGLTVALARTFKIIDPTVKNPQTLHWDRAIEIFNLLL
ncbi:DUF1931 family protein [Rhodocaloribacter sp.]